MKARIVLLGATYEAEGDVSFIARTSEVWRRTVLQHELMRARAIRRSWQAYERRLVKLALPAGVEE